jgi:hypothetical protein
MRVRFPSLLMPRRRRSAAAAPVEHIGSWRDAAPLTVTVSMRPLTTVGERLRGNIRPLATRGIVVPARLTTAMARPIDGRPVAEHLPAPAPTRPRRPAVPSFPWPDQASQFVTPEPELEFEPDESSWTDDDSIAELRAILTAARRQATDTDVPDTAWQAPENPLPGNAEPGTVRQSWPAPGEPPVRLPWAHDEPEAAQQRHPFAPPAPTAGQQSPTRPRPTVPGRTRVPAGSATPGRSRPVTPATASTPQDVPAPDRPRRLTLAESRRQGITVRPRPDEPVAPTPTPAVPVTDTPSADIPVVPAFPAPPEPATTEPSFPEQPDEPGVPTIQRPARQDTPPDQPDTPPDPTPGSPTADLTEPEPAPPAEVPPDLPSDVRDAPVETVRVTTTGRQVVAPRGPAVGRLPDVEPADLIEPTPATEVVPSNPPAVPRTRPATPPPVVEPVGPSDVAGPTTHVRPTRTPERPLPRATVRPPAEPPPERPRLGLGAPLHHPAPPPAPEPEATRPAPGPGVTRPAPEPVDPPTAATTVEPVAWTIDAGFELPPVPVLRETVSPAVEGYPETDELWVDDPVPPRPRQVVTPNPPARGPGLGAPLASGPGRRPDLSDVTVHRGPAVNAQARAWQARAFTRDGEIYLPDGFDHREEQATLAHELVHVVQQQTYGGALPPEWTAAGRALEQEAVAGTHGFAPPQPSYQPQFAEPQQRAPVLVPAGVQREPDLLPAAFTPPQIDDTPPPPGPEVRPDVLADYHEQLIALCDKRTVDLNDSRSIGELAAKLYQPLRGLLRGELIVDRERAGLLSDFR